MIGAWVVLSLTNVVLALVPLVAFVFGTMHVYHAREFIEMMLAQPVGRRPLYAFVFTAVTFALALRFDERAVGLGAAIIVWLLTVVVYDGLLLLAVAALGDWPIETPALVASLLNPVDLGRVLLLLQFDLSALAGYTGAIFERLFGGHTAMLVASAALLLWIAVPLAIGLRRFQRKDW